MRRIQNQPIAVVKTTQAVRNPNRIDGPAWMSSGVHSATTAASTLVKNVVAPCALERNRVGKSSCDQIFHIGSPAKPPPIPPRACHATRVHTETPNTSG